MSFILTCLIIYATFIIWCVRNDKFQSYDSGWRVVAIVGGILCFFITALFPVSHKYDEVTYPKTVIEGKEYFAIPGKGEYKLILIEKGSPIKRMDYNIFGAEMGSSIEFK